MITRLLIASEDFLGSSIAPPTAKYCLCALLSRRRDAKAKNEAILQGGRLGGKRGAKAVQVEVFLPGTDDPPSLGRYPALRLVTWGCSSFGFVGLGILIIAFIRMFQMYFGRVTLKLQIADLAS